MIHDILNAPDLREQITLALNVDDKTRHRKADPTAAGGDSLTLQLSAHLRMKQSWNGAIIA